MAGVGAEGADKFLGFGSRFSSIFLIKSYILRLKSQKNSRLRRAFTETFIFELLIIQNPTEILKIDLQKSYLFDPLGFIPPLLWWGPRWGGGDKPNDSG